MAALIAFYSRAGENYFSGAHRAIAVGNTEQAARLLAELTGAELFRRRTELHPQARHHCRAELLRQASVF